MRTATSQAAKLMVKLRLRAILRQAQKECPKPLLPIYRILKKESESPWGCGYARPISQRPPLKRLYLLGCATALKAKPDAMHGIEY